MRRWLDQALGVIVIGSGVGLAIAGVFFIVAGDVVNAVWWSYVLVVVGLMQVPLGARMFRFAGRRN